ncbi:hypothetical protein GCM10027093_24420 [Paraburkholderia jirisanensis]
MKNRPVLQRHLDAQPTDVRCTRIFQSEFQSAFAAGRKLAGLALCAALAGLSGAAQAAPEANTLADYAALDQALAQGNAISVQVDLSRCTSKEGDHGPNVRGGVRIDSYFVGPDRVIVFIDAHRTLDAQNHPSTNYVRYRVAPDQSVTVIVALAADSAATATPRGEYRCAINQGVRFIAVSSR